MAAKDALARMAYDLRGSLQLLDSRAPLQRDAKDPRNEIQTLCKVANKLVTQMQLTFSGSVVEGADELVKEVFEAFHALILVVWTATAAAGDVLYKHLKAHINAVVESVQRFVQVAIETDAGGTIDNCFTGMMWEAIEKLSKLKLSNRASIVGELKKSVDCIKDAAKEMKDLKESAAARESHDSEDEESLSEAEQLVAHGAWKAIRATFEIAKRLGVAIATSAEPTTKEEAQVMETTLKLVDGCSNIVDDLGAAMYSPQDPDTVQEATLDLQGMCSQMIEKAKTLNPTLDELEGLQKDVDAVTSEILEASKALRC